MALKVFFHCACMNGQARWQAVVREIVETVRLSSLEERAEKLFVCVATEKGIRRRVPEGLREILGPKWEMIYWSRLDQYEFPALDMLWHKTEPGDRVCYLHTKGVSKNPAQPYGNATEEWRRYMLWAVVERWRECVAALANNDIAGAQWHQRHPQWCAKIGSPGWFAGNFWWARGDYVKRLAVIAGETNRWLAEGWIGRGIEWDGEVAKRVFEIHRLVDNNIVGFDSARKTGIFQPGFCRKFYTPDPPLKERRELRFRWDVLNHLVRKHGYKRYLEIGVANADTFRRVECADKTGVDPHSAHATHKMTSDSFFSSLSTLHPPTLPLSHSPTLFDLIFVDGLHVEAQVDRDVENALAHLAPGGTIVLHDVSPESEWEQQDLAEYDGIGAWTGTVWKSWAKLRLSRPDLEMQVVDIDHGVGVIRRGSQVCFQEPSTLNLEPGTFLAWPFYFRHRAELLNLVLPEDFA